MIRANARPHPGPLPRGEGERGCGAAEKYPVTVATAVSLRFAPRGARTTSGAYISKQRRMIHPLLGERAGVRASVNSIFPFICSCPLPCGPELDRHLAAGSLYAARRATARWGHRAPYRFGGLWCPRSRGCQSAHSRI